MKPVKMSGSAMRTVLGLVFGLTDAALMFSSHIVVHVGWSREEMFMHLALLATSYACVSVNGFREIADAYKTWKSS